MRRLMIWQMISAPRWWNQMSLVVLLTCFKIRTQTYASCLSKPLLPWRKSVGWYIVLYCTKIDDPADNFRSRMVETNFFDRIFDLLQDLGWGACQSSAEVITALAEFCRLISLCTAQRLMIWQTSSVPRWWNQMSFIAFLTCFTIGT